jgi:hypothetical protein
MPPKKSAQKGKNSVKKREKAEAEAEAMAEAAALAVSEASPPGAGQAPESKSQETGSHTSPSSEAAAAATGEEPAGTDDSLVTPETSSLPLQSEPSDAGLIPPSSPGVGGIDIVGGINLDDHKDSVFIGAANLLNSGRATSHIGASAEHHSDSSNSGSRNISSVVRVLLGMTGHSEDQSEASGASDDVSDTQSTVSEASDGQTNDLLGLFTSKSTGMSFYDLIDYIRLRGYPTLIGHSLNCVDNETGMIVVRALCLIAHYAHLKHLTDLQLRSCLQFVPPCVAATRGLNELSTAQTESFNVLNAQLVEPTSEQLLDAFTDASGEFLLSEANHWGIPQQRIFEGVVRTGTKQFGIPIEFTLYTTVSTQLAHAGQSQFVGSPPESTKLTQESTSPFGFQRRVLSSALTASTTKARATDHDTQTSTDSGFAGSTSGGARTVPLCITKLSAHLSGFGVRIGTTNLPDLLFQAMSVAAAFAAEPLFADSGPTGGLPASTRLYLMKLDAIQQWILRLLFTLMSVIIEKSGGDSASNTIFRDTYLSPNGRAVSSVFQQMPPSVMMIVADRLGLDCQSGVYALAATKKFLRSQTSHMGLVETQSFLAIKYNPQLGAFAHAQRTREAQQHVAEVAVLGDSRHPCANFMVGLWFFVSSINLWLSKNPDAPQASITGVKALNIAYASGSISDWEQLYSLLGIMSTKGQLRGQSHKPRAFNPEMTDGHSGNLSGSVNAATKEWVDYSGVPDKAAFLHGAAAILMKRCGEEDLQPFRFFERITTQVKGQGGKLQYAHRLKRNQDGTAVSFPAEALSSDSLLSAYDSCMRAVMPTLSGGQPNPKYNQAFATAPKDRSGDGARSSGASGGKGGKGGRGGGKGGKGYRSVKEDAIVLAAAQVEAAKLEAEIEDRKVKKVEAAALKAEERARDQLLVTEKQADVRSKEMATVLAAQEARTDAKILLLEKAHAESLTAMTKAHALSTLTASQQSVWGGHG